MYVQGSMLLDRAFEEWQSPEIQCYGTLPSTYHVVKELWAATLLQSGTIPPNLMEERTNGPVLGRYLGFTGLDIIYLQAKVAGHLWGDLFCQGWREYKSFPSDIKALCIG